MRSKGIYFFATNTDIREIVDKFESTEQVEYYKTGLFDSPSILHFDSLLDYPELGYVDSGDWNHNDNFLALPKGLKLNVRDVEQRKGGVKFAVDQEVNAKSIAFKPGGVFKEGTMVAGSVTTISVDEVSLIFFKGLSKL